MSALKDSDPSPALVACHECDLVQEVHAPVPGAVISCARCDAHLHRPQGSNLDRVLPLTLAALILFVIANANPIVSLHAAGARSSAGLVDAVVGLFQQGIPLVASVVALTTLIVPTVELTILIYLLVALRSRARFWRLESSLRLLDALRPWAMLEVFLLGVLVSLVKLGALAQVVPGLGLWALAGVIVLTAAAHSSFDGQDYWERLQGHS